MVVFSNRSIQNLRNVHPSLVAVVYLGLKNGKYCFEITEGVRSLERQRELFDRGSSKTMDSKHLIQLDGYAHAVDIVAVGDLNQDGTIDAQDKNLTWDKTVYDAIAFDVAKASDVLCVPIRWGGSFKNFYDGVHYEIV